MRKAGWATAVLIVVGIAAVVAGIIYLIEPARSLPSFFPGHQVGIARHHSKRGIAGIVVGVVLFALAWVTSGDRSTKSQS